MARAGGKICNALKRGTLDAREGAGPYRGMHLSLRRVARYYYFR